MTQVAQNELKQFTETHQAALCEHLNKYLPYCKRGLATVQEIKFISGSLSGRGQYAGGELEFKVKVHKVGANRAQWVAVKPTVARFFYGQSSIDRLGRGVPLQAHGFVAEVLRGVLHAVGSKANLAAGGYALNGWHTGLTEGASRALAKRLLSGAAVEGNKFYEDWAVAS